MVPSKVRRTTVLGPQGWTSVPSISLYGTWRVQDMISDEELVELAKFANALETRKGHK